MEPAIEVATLVVSYLWTLRDLFPEKSRVGEFDRVTLKGDLAKTIHTDIALAVRLADAAWREPNERWEGVDGDVSPDASVDQLLAEASARRQPQIARLEKFTRAQLTRLFRSYQQVF